MDGWTISWGKGEKPNCINIPLLRLGFQGMGKNEQRVIMLSQHQTSQIAQVLFLHGAVPDEGSGMV
jgi:hypothetical protein